MAAFGGVLGTTYYFGLRRTSFGLRSFTERSAYLTEVIAHSTEIIAASEAFISVADALILEIEIKAGLGAFISVTLLFRCIPPLLRSRTLLFRLRLLFQSMRGPLARNQAAHFYFG